MRLHGLVVCALSVAALPLFLSGCDKVRDWVEGKKGGGLGREGEVPGAGQYDKASLKRKLGEPQQETEKLAWIKKEHGLRYNNRWYYYYRTKPDARNLTVRILYFIDDKFQGSVIIDEEGRAKREKVTPL